MIKYGAMVILVFMFTGCVFTSPVLSSYNSRGGFLVTKPPIQITYSGDLSEEEKKVLIEVIKLASEVQYEPYRFNTLHKVDLEANSLREYNHHQNMTSSLRYKVRK